MALPAHPRHLFLLFFFLLSSAASFGAQRQHRAMSSSSLRHRVVGSSFRGGARVATTKTTTTTTALRAGSRGDSDSAIAGVPGEGGDEEDALPWPMLGALLFVYVNNQWSRSLIYYLVSFAAGASADEFINVGLGFDETQYSILASFGFTALFAVSSLLAGRLTDRNDRALLTAGSCLVWGLATVATAFAPSFAFVLLFRVIQGVSQGVTTPAAYGLLADAFPASKVRTWIDG